METALRTALQSELSQTKDERFGKIHFEAWGSAAKSDILQNVTINWKTRQPTDHVEDVEAFTVDHTLYWKSFLTPDGYTKINDTYDCSSGTPRLTNSRVVDTNGWTQKKVLDFAVDLTVETIKDELRKSAQTPTPSP